jgi:hypothetical protein
MAVGSQKDGDNSKKSGEKGRWPGGQGSFGLSEDRILRHMLETPPQPRKAGGKKNKGDGRRLRTSQRKR